MPHRAVVDHTAGGFWGHIGWKSVDFRRSAAEILLVDGVGDDFQTSKAL